MPEILKIGLALRWRLVLGRGLISVIFACLAFNFPIGVPIATTGTLAVVWSCYLLFDCVIAFRMSEATRSLVVGEQQWPFVFEALVGFFLAWVPVVLVVDRLNALGDPAFPAGLWGFLYGIPSLDWVPGSDLPAVTLRWATRISFFWSLFRGFSLLRVASQLPYGYGGWSLGIAGVATLAWGLLLELYAAPEPSTLMVWFGCYALLFGAAMLAFALRLRAPSHDLLNPFEAGLTLQGISHTLFRASEFVATGGFAAIVVVLLCILIAFMQRQTIDIRTILVPKEWERDGYTDLAAARSLQDAINRIVSDASSAMPKPQLFLGEEPEVLVHEVWFRPESIAGWLGTELGLRRRQEIAGEITVDDCHIRATIRFNGSSLMVRDKPLRDCRTSHIDYERILSELLQAPAGEILLLTHPYLVAEACEPYNAGRALEIIDTIIAAHAHYLWQDVAWAYNFKGLKAEQDKDLDSAKKYFEKSIEVWPGFSVGYNNLNELLSDAARQNFLLERVHRNSHDAGARYDLGLRMHEMRKDGYAEDQFRLVVALGREAIGHDPTDAQGYDVVGGGLYRIAELHGFSPTELSEARAALGRAVELDPYDYGARLWRMLALWQPARGGPCSIGYPPETAMYPTMHDQECAEAWSELAAFKTLDPNSTILGDAQDFRAAATALEALFGPTETVEWLRPRCPSP